MNKNSTIVYPISIPNSSLIQKRTFIEEADHDKSFRTSSPLLFNAYNSQFSNIDISNIPTINAEYLNMSDDDYECNNNISLNG